MLYFMMLESDGKFKEKVTCGLENDIKNLTNFHQSTQKSKNWDFYWVLLSKVESVWARTLQGCYVLWQWRMIQNWKRYWHEEFNKFLTRALANLKNFYFHELLLTKVYNVGAKESTEELCLMALNIGIKFVGELTCAFKNDMRDLTNFHQSMFKSLKIGTFIELFYPK